MTKFSRVVAESTTMVGYEEIPGGHRIVWGDGTIEYYDSDNRYHRTDGPAYVNKESGISFYFVHGKRFDKEEFEKHFDND